MLCAGVVEAVDGNILHVSFLMRSRRTTNNYFKWPQDPDKQELPREEILCILDNPPVPSSAREFVVENSRDIDDLMANVLK